MKSRATLDLEAEHFRAWIIKIVMCGALALYCLYRAFGG